MGFEFIQQQNQDIDNAMQQYQEEQRALKEAEPLFQTQDAIRLIKAYIEENIPDKIKKDRLISEFWAILGKTPMLTFLDKEDIEQEFMPLFEQAKHNYIMSMPPYEFTFKDRAVLKQLEIFFRCALKRSVGTSAHRFNERIIQGESITQMIRSNTEAMHMGGSSGKGFMSKVRGLF